MNAQAPDDLEIERLLRAHMPDRLPPRLASGRLWAEIETRRRPRNVAVISPIVLDVRAAVQLALSPGLAGLRR